MRWRSCSRSKRDRRRGRAPARRWWPICLSAARCRPWHPPTGPTPGPTPAQHRPNTGPIGPIGRTPLRPCAKPRAARNAVGQGLGGDTKTCCKATAVLLCDGGSADGFSSQQSAYQATGPTRFPPATAGHAPQPGHWSGRYERSGRHWPLSASNHGGSVRQPTPGRRTKRQPTQGKDWNAASACAVAIDPGVLLRRSAADGH